MRIKTLLLGVAFAAAASSPATSATLGPNLVSNGGFETLTNGIGQIDHNTTAMGWTSAGYNFVFDAGTADGTGVNGAYGNISLWGSNNGGANLFTASPTGGNFVAADGAYEVAPIQQVLTGLVVGKDYIVSFHWAAAQQAGYDGPTTEQWKVSLGGQTIATDVFANPEHGFSGWMHEDFRFKFDGANNVLSFLALGTPNGLPPFSLLDGVSAAAVPEPAAWAMMLFGFALVGAAARRRNRTAVVA